MTYIVGLDYTASNLQQGIKTYGGKSLHDTNTADPNPYKRVCFSVLGSSPSYSWENPDVYSVLGSSPSYSWGEP